MHAFARETRPSHEEWTRAIEYLTRAGKESTEFKNEFILLSDCLGMSALIDELNHPKPPVRAPAHLMLRPPCAVLTAEYYLCVRRAARTAASRARSTRPTRPSSRPGPPSPRTAPPASCSTSARRSRTRAARASRASRPRWCVASPRVRALHAVRSPRREQWQADGDGLYDVQYPDRPEINDRARIVAEPSGEFSYRGRLPVAYPIVGVPCVRAASRTALMSLSRRAAQRWPDRRLPACARPPPASVVAHPLHDHSPGLRQARLSSPAQTQPRMLTILL